MDKKESPESASTRSSWTARESHEQDVVGTQTQPNTSKPHDEENIPPTKKEQETKDPNLVEWAPNDPDNPREWSTPYKSWITFQLGMLAFSASLGSSIVAPAEKAIGSYVGVDSEVVVLSISLYIIGFAVGPLIWAPASEIWGRRISLLPALFCLGLFSIGTATSKNAASIFITRFFGGVFGSAPVSNVSAALGDVWNQKARGTAVALYAVAVVGGPTLGPVIGAALTVSHLGWRWTEYIEAICVFAVFTMAFFFLPELYAPVLLKRKAQSLRKETGNQDLYHPHEHLKLDFKNIMTKQFSRPIVMLTTEPMVTAIAFYASFVYALLYMTLEVFPIVFEDERGWEPVVAATPFLGLFVGVLLALGLNLGNQPRYARKVDEAKGEPVPEARLPPMVIGAFSFAIGLFLFGWTASPKIHWILPVIATVFIGCGFNVIFQQCINFLVDTYGMYAASAVSANTFLRSLLAAGLPLAARPMFLNLGVGPAMSILGGVAVLALPVPFILMKYGYSLRQRSKFVSVNGPGR